MNMIRHRKAFKMSNGNTYLPQKQYKKYFDILLKLHCLQSTLLITKVTV